LKSRTGKNENKPRGSLNIYLQNPTFYAILYKGGETMTVLPRYEQAVLPVRKFTDYALNPDKQPHKALAFKLALGYDLSNYEKLIENIKRNIGKFSAKAKQNKGFGDVYEVVLTLKGENGKTANVLTGWIDDINNGEMRLTSIYIIDKGRSYHD